MIAELRERADRQGFAVAVMVAQIRMALGDMDAAFDLLEEGVAVRDPSLLWLKASGFWANGLASEDPRYADLVRRVGLP